VQTALTEIISLPFDTTILTIIKNIENNFLTGNIRTSLHVLIFFAREKRSAELPYVQGSDATEDEHRYTAYN